MASVGTPIGPAVGESTKRRGSTRIYKDDLARIVLPPYSGLGVYGGIIAGTVAAFAYVRWKGQPFLRWADAVAPGLFAMQAIARWGNFFNQELYGAPTNLPWGIAIQCQDRTQGYQCPAGSDPTTCSSCSSSGTARCGSSWSRSRRTTGRSSASPPPRSSPRRPWSPQRWSSPFGIGAPAPARTASPPRRRRLAPTATGSDGDWLRRRLAPPLPTLGPSRSKQELPQDRRDDVRRRPVPVALQRSALGVGEERRDLRDRVAQ